MTAVDSRDTILALLTQQRPEDLKGMTESEWVDFKGVGPAGPYDLRLGSKKFELAKDVAAFANAAGGLIVCGFKATRRPTDLHETVVKQTPFEKNLVNAETYKAVIAEYVRPPIRVQFIWYDDPDKPHLGYLVIEVPALPESDRWALVTRPLSEDGELVKGGVAIPRRHGDSTQYVQPDEVYRMVNHGLRSGPAIDLGLSVVGGAALDVTVADDVIEALLEMRRRSLLSSLPQSEQRPRRHHDGAALRDSERWAVEEYLRLKEVAEKATSNLLTRDVRSPQEYREEVDAYLGRSRAGLLRTLNRTVALQKEPLAFRLVNCSDAMFHQVEVIATLDPGYEVIVDGLGSVPDLNNLPWPEPPVPYGQKTLVAGAGLVGAGFPAFGAHRAGRGVSPRRFPEWTRSEDGLVIKFPPVDLRARAEARLGPIVLYGQPSADAAVLHWAATCTNLDGRHVDTLRIPVQHLDVTLPPDADGLELVGS